jgi:alpha-L-fucosidase 2
MIDLLPALPKAWPAGTVKGLRARGGFTVDLVWKGGRVATAKITSALGRPARVRINGEIVALTLAAGTGTTLQR